MREFKYTNKVDIWAMGCIFYELACCRKAFRDDFAVFESQKPPRFPRDVPLSDPTKSFLSEIVMEMLDRDSTRRPTAALLHEMLTWSTGRHGQQREEGKRTSQFMHRD